MDEKEPDCKNPEQKGWDVCNEKDPYMADFKYQEKCIEHRDHWTPVFYYGEATGDIFREVSKGRKVGEGYWFDRAYVREKLSKLKTINDYNVADLKEKINFTTPEKRKLLEEFLKRVNQWEKVTNPDLFDKETGRFVKTITPDCKGLNVKEVQIESIHLIKDITKWGLDEIPLSTIQYSINDYVKKVNRLLDISNL